MSTMDAGASSSSTEGESKKRTVGVLTWDEYFMGVAFLSAQRSKDPNTQVGACIVNPQHRIVGTGYNGMPNGCKDDDMPWGKESKDPLEKKYFYVCHAELNAIVNKNQADTNGCQMYVSLYPCNECAKLIVQSGIKEVIFYSDKYHDSPESEAARNIFSGAGVKTREYDPNLKSTIEIEFEDNN